MEEMSKEKPINFYQQKLTLDSAIEEFLEKINLSNHAEVLKQKGYQNVKDLQSLLDDKGVELLKPTKDRILLEYVTQLFFIL